MPEYVLKLRCPTCKHEEEVVIEAPDAEKARIEGSEGKCCPRQATIKMEVVALQKKDQGK
jgi:hypothetical protein